MTEQLAQPEFDMEAEQVQVRKMAEISFGRGMVGRRYPLEDAQAEADFAAGLARHTREITKPNTADCPEDRKILRLADGTADPGLLRARIVPQLFGGQGLAATKAVTAAGAAIVRDAKTMWQAYEKVSTTLAEMGEEDGGHNDCGASKSVESSVAQRIDPAELVPAIFLFTAPKDGSESLIRRNTVHKRELLMSGFYGDWDPKKHEDYLASRFPGNFSYLDIDHDDKETAGHNASGLYVITEENAGFAKNAFIEDTGRWSFGLTPPKMRQIAHMLGGSAEERERILLAFIDDSLHVSSGIVTEGFPVFSDAAAA